VFDRPKFAVNPRENRLHLSVFVTSFIIGDCTTTGRPSKAFIWNGFLAGGK
jgi:hypothetical protein